MAQHKLYKMLNPDKAAEDEARDKAVTSPLAKAANSFWKYKVKGVQNTRVQGKFRNFSVSEVGKEARLIYLSSLGYIVFTTDTPSFRRMANGNYVHDRWKDWLKEMESMPVSVEPNGHRSLPFKVVQFEGSAVIEELSLRGRYDGLISIEGKLYIWELKSIYDSGFQKLDEPEWNHICQQSMYCYATKVPLGVITYENKDNQTPRYFDIEVNLETGDVVARGKKGEYKYPALVRQIEKKLRYIRTCIEQNKVPIKCTGCSTRCDFAAVCANVSAGKEILPFPREEQK